jgi:hypothetical protein
MISLMSQTIAHSTTSYLQSHPCRLYGQARRSIISARHLEMRLRCLLLRSLSRITINTYGFNNPQALSQNTAPTQLSRAIIKMDPQLNPPTNLLIQEHLESTINAYTAIRSTLYGSTLSLILKDNQAAGSRIKKQLQRSTVSQLSNQI